MIECPHCKIAYSPSYETCPKCKNFLTPQAARKEYLQAKAAERIYDGDLPVGVRTDLIADGFSELEADELIGRESSALARQNRGYGFLRFAIGVVMMIFGAGAVLLGLLTLGAKSPVRLDGYLLGVMLIGGTLMFFAGLLAVLSGGFATVTGKEPGIGPSGKEFVDDEGW